jgi:hypothetical protein
MPMTIPIIFAHRGISSMPTAPNGSYAYVTIALAQAKKSNPRSRVILLGTPYNTSLCPPGTEHHLMSHYSHGAQAFIPHYRHDSVNSVEYNRFCFERWFILRDFMRDQNIRHCLFLDSDVMLYADVSDPTLQRFSYEYSWTTFTTLDQVDRFCDLTMYLISDYGRFEVVKAYARMHQNLVDDMILTRCFLDREPHYQYTYGYIGKSYFDLNIHFDNGFQMIHGRKKVYLRNGTFYVKTQQTQEFYRLCTLHFQGYSKGYMAQFFQPDYWEKDRTYYFDYASNHWVDA